jgi:hypothetical protein
MTSRQFRPRRPRLAFRSSFGGWKDVDTHRLVTDIYESRKDLDPSAC